MGGVSEVVDRNGWRSAHLLLAKRWARQGVDTLLYIMFIGVLNPKSSL